MPKISGTDAPPSINRERAAFKVLAAQKCLSPKFHSVPVGGGNATYSDGKVTPSVRSKTVISTYTSKFSYPFVLFHVVRVGSWLKISLKVMLLFWTFPFPRPLESQPSPQGEGSPLDLSPPRVLT
jgi:hypothetical protein